ncbi:unnamed protein product [marine sediment metagenome]|uniref:Gfo/Idh/MocA-like oxidoreductase N-terminal domain-containing protein n=1 Tax=marine sediment metagenome TaxID=412755 RepID=X1BYG9_9ZZZZ
MNVGIIGCGAVAPKHTEAYKGIDGIDVMLAYDVVIDKGNRFQANILGKHWLRGWCDKLDCILESCDLVSICTPSSTHAEIAIQCAKAGVNVICEKPIDIDLGKAQKMIDAFDESDASQ